jgi:two-component system, OmpR family, sensor histidine kinase KdpD
MKEERPDPQQLLKQVEKTEKRKGKLKIFFGACAGVGKTYAMLSAASEKLKENVDVIVGIVETHGRVEIVKLLDNMPFLPMQKIEYHGITLRELDIDAAIARKPSILLVDELAHTNPATSRHPKRWHDIQELLEHGIDIYTTLNVQHIESLNDVVADLTGIRVKETIPDSIFDEADEIVLVDVPSEVIIERLNEGKVYLGEFAKRRASQNFFKIENLITLREIALRRTAERVDALHSLYRKYQAKEGRKSVIDNILVCIGPGLMAIKLIRTAKQLSSKLKVNWTVLYVENLTHETLDDDEKILIEKIYVWQSN